ncbi:MAG: AI-2E family transporter [Ruminococcaceae bacterium]|nr:AI-2E family transporter [Oscillospiraceae bacterium]
MKHSKNPLRRMGRLEWRDWLKWFLLAVAVIVVYKSFDRVSDIFKVFGSFWKILTPFIIAFCIAYFLGKPAAWLEKLFKRQTKPAFVAKCARGFSITIVYIFFIGLLTLIGNAIIPSLISGITSLFANYRTYFDRAEQLINDLTAKYPTLASIDLGSKALQMAEDFISGLDVDTIIGYLESVISVGSTLSSILVGVFISVYMLIERDHLKAVIKRFLSLVFRENTVSFIVRYTRSADDVVFRYFYTQFLDCVIVSIMSTIALAILGAPSPVLLGFCFGMFNMIPYFGPIVAGVGVVFVILMSRDFSTALWATIILLGLQQLDANLINPRILGESLDMSPFWVIFAVTVGGGLFGFGGMLLSVPALAVLRMLYRELLIWRKNQRRTPAAENQQT